MTGADRLAPLFSWRSAICESDLSPVTRHVALTLSLHMNERGGSAFPGATRIARETGLHVATVKERLAELERTGWLLCISRGGLAGENRHANEYASAIPFDRINQSPTATGSPRRPVATDDPSPLAQQPVATGDPSTSMSTSIDTANANPDYEVGFREWWANYPRKREKRNAHAAYLARRRQGIPHETLIAAAKHYANNTDPAWLKYPASFLNGAEGPWTEWVDGPPEPNQTARTQAEPARPTLGRGLNAHPQWELDPNGNATRSTTQPP